MPVTLHLPTVLSRLAADQRALELEGATVGAVIALAAQRFPQLAPRLRDAEGSLHPFLNLYVNDEDVRFNGGLAAPVKDGDELTIVPAIAGGASGS